MDSTSRLGRMRDAVVRIGIVLLLPLAMIVALISGLLSRPIVRDRAIVAELLRRRLHGTQGRGEWDEFLCVRIADKQLDALRKACAEVESEMGSADAPVYLSSAGVMRLETLLTKLEGVEQADAADERAPTTMPPARS